MSKFFLTGWEWWILLGFWTLGQLQRFELPLFGMILPIYGHELIMAVWVVINFKLLRKAPLDLRNFFKKSKILGWFLVWVALGIMVSLDDLGVFSLLYLSRLIFYLTFFWVAKYNLKNNTQKVMLREKLIVAGLLALILGMLQYLFLPDTRFLKILGWDDHYFRMIGSFFDPGFLGIILVITWGYLSSLKWLQKLPIGLMIFQSLVAGGIALTFSRASYLAFFILIVFQLFHKKIVYEWKLWTITVSVFMFILTLIFAPKPTGEGVILTRTSTIDSRVAVWKNALPDQIIDNLLGQGLFLNTKSQLGYFLTPDHAHLPDNLFVMIFQATGLIGLILFIWAGINEWKKIYQIEPNMASIILATVTHSQFNNTLLERFVLIFLLSGLISMQKSKA